MKPCDICKKENCAKCEFILDGYKFGQKLGVEEDEEWTTEGSDLVYKIVEGNLKAKLPNGIYWFDSTWARDPDWLMNLLNGKYKAYRHVSLSNEDKDIIRACKVKFISNDGLGIRLFREYNGEEAVIMFLDDSCDLFKSVPTDSVIYSV